MLRRDLDPAVRAIVLSVLCCACLYMLMRSELLDDSMGAVEIEQSPSVALFRQADDNKQWMGMVYAGTSATRGDLRQLARGRWCHPGYSL